MFKEKKRKEVLAASTDFSRVVDILVNIAFLVISGFLIFNSVRTIQNSQEKLAILQRAENEVTALRLRNIELILEKEKIETIDYTETDIRNRFNYSKNNEILFVIPDEIMDISRKQVDIILKEEETKVDSKEVWEVWYDLIINGN